MGHILLSTPLSIPPPFCFSGSPYPIFWSWLTLCLSTYPFFFPPFSVSESPHPTPLFPPVELTFYTLSLFPWKLTTPPPLFPPVSLPSRFRSPYTLSPVPVRAYYPPPFSLLLSLPSLSQSRSGVLLGGQCLSYWLPPWWSCKTLLWHHCFPTAS